MRNFVELRLLATSPVNLLPHFLHTAYSTSPPGTMPIPFSASFVAADPHAVFTQAAGIAHEAFADDAVWA